MKKINLLALGVSIALGLSACTPPETKEESAPSVTEVATPLTSGIDLTAIDNTVRIQDDLFRHVNGTWLKTTEIPSDKSGYGVFNVLYDDTQENLKTLIQNAAKSTAEKGSNPQKLGDMYNSYMDVELANTLGLTPLQPILDDINAIENMEQLSKMFGELYVLGVAGPFGYYNTPDAKNPTIEALYLYQSGLT
ncbi:MAG: M13 family metallopeptidase N-terminal domain-containing protein, partial [Paraglaciecola sp.]